jgi:hypothetical protein
VITISVAVPLPPQGTEELQVSLLPVITVLSPQQVSHNKTADHMPYVKEKQTYLSARQCFQTCMSMCKHQLEGKIRVTNVLDL